MDLAAIQKYAPMLGLLGRKSGSTSDQELGVVAKVLAGNGDPEPLASFLCALRDATPATKVADLLGSPGAKSLLESFKTQMTKVESGIFCTCPDCGTSFETDL